jgi:signal transduction histidine kinase
MAEDCGHELSGIGGVVVLPPTSADVGAIEDLMAAHRISCTIVHDMKTLCAAIQRGAGAIVVPEEALTIASSALTTCIAEQDIWSDLPVIVLSRSGAESVALSRILPALGNVSVIEPSQRNTTLVSQVRSALRARARQYQVRDYLVEEARTQEALREREQAERTARSAAERSSRINDALLATLSHELRTPLHAVLAWSQILRKSPALPPKVVEGLSVIERSSRSQAQIIGDLLDVSSIISGTVRLDVQSVELGSIVEAAVDAVRPAAHAKEILLRVVLDPLACPVRGDPGRLQQIFWNLIANAVKFTAKGGRVSVGLERVDSHLEINIEDTGEGIDPTFLPHVFDRFRQADASTARAHGGLGLGLSIVKQLVELHGGTVSAKSPGKGAGSNFRVSLPLMTTIEGADNAKERGHPACS